MFYRQEKKIAAALIAMEEVLEKRYGFDNHEDGFFMDERERLLWCSKELSRILPAEAMEEVNRILPGDILYHGYVCDNTRFDNYHLQFFCFCSTKGDNEISLDVFLGLASPEVSVDMTIGEEIQTPEDLLERANRDYDGSLLFFHNTYDFPVETAFHPFIDEIENLVDELMGPDSLVYSLEDSVISGTQEGSGDSFECNDVFFKNTWAHIDEFLFYFATDYDKDDVPGNLDVPNLPGKIRFIGVRKAEDIDIEDDGGIAQFAVLLKDYLPSDYINCLDKKHADTLKKLDVDTIGDLRLVVNFEARLPEAMTVQYGFAYPKAEWEDIYVNTQIDGYTDFKKGWTVNSDDCDPWSYCITPIFDQGIVNVSHAVPETNEDFPERVRYVYNDYVAPLMTPGIPSQINETVKPYLEKALSEGAVEVALASFLDKNK